MNYSIVLLSYFFIFQILFEYLKYLIIFQIVKYWFYKWEYKKKLFSNIVKFSKFVNVSNLKIPNIWSFSKLVNHSYLRNYLIFQILNFWGWALEFRRSKMRIGESTKIAEYQIDEQNENFPIFGINLWFSKLKKKLQFRKSSNFHYWVTQKKIKILKLLNSKN